EGAGTKPEDASEAQVTAYVAALEADGRKPSSIARALVAIRSFHRHLGTTTGADVDPPIVPTRHPAVLDAHEVDRLLAAVPAGGAVARRDRAIVEVLWATGVRISELVALDLADVAAETAGPSGGGPSIGVVGPDGRRRRVHLGTASGPLERWLAFG